MSHTWRRSCAALIAALAIGGGAATAAQAAFPTNGTPVTSSDLTPNPGHVATPMDDVMHPGSWIEWWYVLLMDPESKRQYIGLMVPTGVAGVLQFADGVRAFSTSPDAPIPVGAALTPPAFPDGLPGVRTTAGSLNYNPFVRAYHYKVNSGFKADVWFNGDPVPGATGTIDLRRAGQWMGWTAPVASSTVSGWIKGPGGERIDVTGWRGYHDHNWGRFTFVDQQADGWEWGVSFEPDGGSTLIGGVVRTGGEWAGAVVDARPHGTRICAASTLTQSDFISGTSPTTGLTYPLPSRTNVACHAPAGGDATPRPGIAGWPGPYDFATTFNVTDLVTNDLGLVAASFETRIRTVPGSFGAYEHVRTLTARIQAQLRQWGWRGTSPLSSLLED